MVVNCSTSTILSFHSISFPNEWGGAPQGTRRVWSEGVSIQLVSPTSGEESA
jgi:hypothetical protein